METRLSAKQLSHQFDSGRGLPKMKKTALILISLSVFALAPARVFAQTFNAQKAYSDYQYQLSIYQKANSDYQDAKTFYKGNPTLQLREDARKATLNMLKNRDQLMIVYLTAIRMQFVETTGFDDNQKGPIFGKIDPEVAWYKDHMQNYQDGDPLDTLFVKSDGSKARYTASTLLVIDESLFDIGLSQEIGLRIAHQQIYSDLTNYINDQVEAGKLRIDPFNRWLNDTDAVLTMLQTNETAAAAKIQLLYTQDYGLSQGYNNAIQALANSISPLTQLNNYLTEMLTTIQNQTQ